MFFRVIFILFISFSVYAGDEESVVTIQFLNATYSDDTSLGESTYDLISKKLIEIAENIGCTPAQAAIKWCLYNGCITVPKSSSANRIEENLSSLDVNLDTHIHLFNELEENYISGWDPTSEA